VERWGLKIKDEIGTLDIEKRSEEENIEDLQVSEKTCILGSPTVINLET
jgi:hypothetical protein